MSSETYYYEIFFSSTVKFQMSFTEKHHQLFKIIHIPYFMFLNRYGTANMAAVKPMMQQQQQHPGGAKPNTSYNNNNGRTAAPSMQREQSITQVREIIRKFHFLY